MEQFKPGLEGVVVSETEISVLDTEVEKIVIRGYDLIELAKTNSYVDIVHLLLEGELPTDEQRQEVEKKLHKYQALPTTVLDILKLQNGRFHPMDAQRTGVSVLAGYDDDLEDRSHAMNIKRSYMLLAQLPIITANSYRILVDEPTLMPKDDLSYSANFLYMITGEVPTEQEVKIFDKSLLLYSEHEMPNSTFTARVIASTNADLYGALTGAVSSLKGNLHGGANEAVMHMLNEVSTPEAFEELIREKLKNKEKIMGFGHRVYMDRMDPRASVMKEHLRELSERDGDDTLLRMCEAGERVMKEEKGLFPNLDYYAAPVYWKLNIPIILYTPIFFVARTAGLTAHIIEQHENNRIFRPRVKYIGRDY
ncbi:MULTISPECIES: citrate synthase [Savagea]|uniref:Citrate synthase n=2 Tax=Savagea TaxID=1655429 RepID=A0A8J7KS81_9BACL|nr:citrate synthase [Savagea serpentis]MBF4500289.1 citrate synthase [Savagea serpentis]